jgi:dimethylhistidine N-methyltransferase
MSTVPRDLFQHDLQPSAASIRAEVLAGLAHRPKRLPSKYLYDARGSKLFERICALPEYYLTRAELALMRAHAAAITAALGPRTLLVEYGSGSATKTSLLLEQLADVVAYVPVEISRSALGASVARLSAQFPDTQMLPVWADFTRPLTLPEPARPPRRTVIYFPGSTIGNFDTDAAVCLLSQMRREMGPDGMALIGVDLLKPEPLIEAAYNDAAGVTAEFTLNLLRRLNEELRADFDLRAFRHRARYHPERERIETHIVSRAEQEVRIDGHRFHFAAGEALQVEISCKYSSESFARIAQRAGLRVAHVWTDPQQLFSVQCLRPAGAMHAHPEPAPAN